MEELRLREKGYEARVGDMDRDEDREIEAAKGTAAKGTAAKSNIFSSLGIVSDAIKSKLTHPTNVVEESRAAREEGSTGRTKTPAMVEVPVEKVEIGIRDTRPGAVAAALKKSDQMFGQTFNDPGSMGDEGKVVRERRVVDEAGNVRVDRSGKM